MSEDREPIQVHPASLKPMSAGCIVPVLVTLAIVGLAYLGLQKIVANTGPWALSAATTSLRTSGLPADQQVPFQAEVDRLQSALDREELESEAVVNGVAGLLETPIIPILVLNDVVDRRLATTQLDEAQRAEVTEAIVTLRAAADAQTLEYKDLVAVLGPLTQTEEGGAPPPLTDAQFLELAERARAATKELEVPKADVEPTFDVLLGRYRDHVTAVLDGTASKVDR